MQVAPEHVLQIVGSLTVELHVLREQFQEQVKENVRLQAIIDEYDHDDEDEEPEDKLEGSGDGRDDEEHRGSNVSEMRIQPDRG